MKKRDGFVRDPYFGSTRKSTPPQALGEWIKNHPYQFCALVGFLIALLRSF
jgi:hypothetical protein